jgi:hypothetical protein
MEGKRREQAVQTLDHLRYTSKFLVTPKQVCDGILTDESFVEVDSPRLMGRDQTIEQFIGALQKVGGDEESTQ